MLAQFLFAAPLPAAELFVAASATPGGDGSSAKPFQAIAPALKALQSGDTVTVRQGTYHEAVALTVPGTPAQPTTLRAAPGARVVISGFAPITGWQPVSPGRYTATIDGGISDLCVGLTPQPISRWPDADQPMRPLLTPDPAAATFRDPGLNDPVLNSIASSPKSLMAFVYLARGNVYSTLSVKSLDPAAGVVTVAPSRALSGLQGKSDRFQLINHPALILKPGQWAYENLAGGKTRITFRPADPADLARTQYRQLGSRGLVRIANPRGGSSTIANIRVEGLEVCGSVGKGIEAGGASNVTIARCIAHNNDSNGIAIRRCADFQILNNIALANGNGIGIASSRNVLLQDNESAFNMVDGLTVAGNVTGKPQGEPETFDVTIRRNFLHHHLLLGHPDNFQTYRGVHRLTLEDNVLLWGGQGIMTEETETATLRNCVVVGTSAIAVIFGHSNSHGWSVERSTIGLGGWGAFSFTGKDYRLHNSIVWDNPLTLPDTLVSDFNLLHRADPSQPIYLVTKPRWRRLMTPVEAATTGREQHSLRADPRFPAAPLFQAPAGAADENPTSTLKLRSADYGVFAPGDRIEINGDGILRTVTAATPESVSFTPPLPARPFRGALIWNWKQAASPALDLRTPVTLGNKPVGATLDIPAFQRGDFNGDGRRDIPDLPPDVASALPNPNAPVIPIQGQ